jgi:hypothetical protein
MCPRVSISCRKEGQAEALEVGDFGDTNWNKKENQWVSRMMVRRPGQQKRKAICARNGDRAPEIE